MLTARERRLAHEYEEMRKLLRKDSLIHFYGADLSGEEATAFLWSSVTMDSIKQYLPHFHTPEEFEELYPNEPPQKYMVVFRCKGLMKEEGTGTIVVTETHAVEVVYGLDYPERPPNLVWLTPIWHPNIKFPNVCTVGRPFAVGTLLSQLCLMLGRMIQYQVYNVESPLNHEAAEWVRRGHAPYLLPLDQRSLLDGKVHDRPDVSGLVQMMDGSESGPLVELL